MQLDSERAERENSDSNTFYFDPHGDRKFLQYPDKPETHSKLIIHKRQRKPIYKPKDKSPFASHSLIRDDKDYQSPGPSVYKVKRDFDPQSLIQQRGVNRVLHHSNYCDKAWQEIAQNCSQYRVPKIDQQPGPADYNPKD